MKTDARRHSATRGSRHNHADISTGHNTMTSQCALCARGNAPSGTRPSLDGDSEDLVGIPAGIAWGPHGNSLL
eukprot:4302067-Pyramimonas_sp.AAC.1